MIELPSLHDHQGTMRDDLRISLGKHYHSILAAGPGVGKTRIAKWILGATANKDPKDGQSGHCLFAVQGRGLVDNAIEDFRMEPELPHGVVMSNRSTSWGARIQVASIDTLLSWFVSKGDYNTSVSFDLIVYDETHTHLPKLKKFLKYHDAYRQEKGLLPVFLIGLSATPRANGLSNIYRDIVVGPSNQWLIDNGFLSPFRYFRATQGDLGKLIRKGKSFTEESESQAMEGMSGDLVRDWKKFAEGRATVGFFPRRSHAKEAQKALSDAGIRAAYIDGETDDDVRQRIYWELNNDRIDYLCNVQVVERGTNIPRISCIQMCVTIASEERWLQMIGRGSRMDDGKRIDSPDLDPKTDCIILDHGGNLRNDRSLGFFEDERHWSLDQSKGKVGTLADRPTIECPNCQAVYRGGKCRNCGHEPTTKERAAQKLEWDGSELKEVTKSTRKKKIKSAEELMTDALYIAGRRKGSWRTACKIFFDSSRSQGTSYRIPKEITVGGNRYRMVPFGSGDAGRRISTLYPFTKTRGEHTGDYLIGKEQ